MVNRRLMLGSIRQMSASLPGARTPLRGVEAHDLGGVGRGYIYEPLQSHALLGNALAVGNAHAGLGSVVASGYVGDGAAEILVSHEVQYSSVAMVCRPPLMMPPQSILRSSSDFSEG